MEDQPQLTPPLLIPRHPQKAPTHTVPSSLARVGTLQVPLQTISQNSGSHISQMSAPLFTEHRYSTSTDEDHEICDAEVGKITRQTPAQATTISIPPTRLVSTPSTLDHSPQGDPNQVAPPAMNAYSQNNFTTTIQNTNKYLIPDGMDRHIHDLQDKTFHAGILENGYNAYLMELPDLKPLLQTSRYLMDEVTGQFYAIYGSSYQCMCTIPRLLHM